jgi:hypothetical protein
LESRDVSVSDRGLHIHFHLFLRYHKAFIPLPLEGAEINRELARTFQPESDGTSTTGSSTSLQGANPTHFHTKYEEDYSSNVLIGKDYRTAAFRPEVQKHIREENKLIYTDSITHEKFVDLTAGLGSQPREPLKPPIDKPTNASAGFRFKTSYTDEYTDVSALAFRPEQKRGSTNSSRIYGSAVPARIISFKSDNGIHDLLDTSLPPVRDILFGSSVNRPTIIESFPDPSNPYIADFLNQST